MVEKLDHTNGKEQPLVSIITACYNSVPFLERVYNSIKNEGYPNIEWIAVDDKSPDRTLGKLSELKQRNEIPVKIVALPQNTRAFGAVVAGIDIASGPYTIILDHDDELIPGAISKLLATWRRVATPGEKIFSIWGRCINEKDELMGKLYPQFPVVNTVQYLLHVLKNRSEFFLMLDTDLLRRYYKLKPGETTKTNGDVWAEMSQHYKAIFTNDIVRKYYTDIPTSQTNQKKTKIPMAFALQEANYLNLNYNVFWQDFVFFFKKIILYQIYSYYAGIGIVASIKKLNYFTLRLIAVLVLPLLPFFLLREKLLNKG